MLLLLFVNFWFIFVYKRQPSVYMGCIFIFSWQIAQLEGISKQRASEVKREIMDSYGKSKPQKLTIDEYCRFRGIPETLIEKQIRNQKNH